MSQLIMNNVVNADTLRKVQLKTLTQLREILVKSFGPNGSNACIKKENALPRYTKDGHTIIGAVHYNGIIEQSIKDDIESITRHIVKTVGDGTTSAVILSSYLFKYMVDLENTGYIPADITNTFEKVVDDVSKELKDRAEPLTVDDVYDIAMISTNGNKMIADTLKKIYDEHGNSVYIDVMPSTGDEFVIKSYDGMSISTGYADPCYVTDATKNTAEVDNPEVYFFEHPIDNHELGVYLDAIISNNIITPVNLGKYENIIPTVIFAPKISQDMSSSLESLVSTMTQMPINNRLPICIITDYIDTEELSDLSQMCGAKTIRKFIDAKLYEAAVKSGKAPTPETINAWAGKCDKVVAYADKTVFVRPSAMYNPDGSYSNVYNSILSYLESLIKQYKEEGQDAVALGRLQRRYNSLKSNMVELYVGGITQADRDSLRDLVEDAVLNVRSASENGVSVAANVAPLALLQSKESSTDYLENHIYTYLLSAYRSLVEILYNHIDFDVPDGKSVSDVVAEKYNYEKLAYNIRDRRWSSNVKTSAMSDITILKTVSKIVGIMATCNQFLVPSAMHNIYEDVK